MNYTTNSIEEIKTHQHLSCYLFYNIYRQTFAVIFFKYLPQIYTQYLEYHAEMIAIRSFIEKSIQQIKHMRVISIEFFLIGLIFLQWFDPFWVKSIFSNFLKDLNFVVGSFEIMWGTFHYFYSHISGIFEVLSEPYGREVSPPKFLNQYISIHEHLPDVTRMISV